MRIAYCEDEPAQRSRMEMLLRTFAERKRLPLTVEAFSDSAAFLFQYPGSYPFDLIFLDIDLGGMDGMALARKIRETDSEVPILFLTNHKEYVFEGYEVQAFRYLLKPVTEDTLFPLLEELQAMRGQEKPHLLLSLGGETQKLFLRRGGVYELVPHGCSKGTAVDYALKQFQLEKEDAYVFGDSSNDLTMFRCGAHTIALGKHDEILDPYTEYVTDTVERDGVAKAMEHYGLI